MGAYTLNMASVEIPNILSLINPTQQLRTNKVIFQKTKLNKTKVFISLLACRNSNWEI